jgi:hypothetical protein
MLRVSKLKRHPRHFHSFTGLRIAEFDQLLNELQSPYEISVRQRQASSPRVRQPGAGRPSALALPERLLMGLIYLRLYVSQRLISFLFDIDQSNVCREFNDRLLPVLLAVLPVPLRDAPLHTASESEQKANAINNSPDDPREKPKRKPRRINTLKELLETYPDLSEVLIDATEQPIPQPEDKQKRKQAYSGKQQDHTVKTQILATKEQILHIFGGLPGCLHDLTVLGASGVVLRVPQKVPIRLDKGYQGASKRYPLHDIKQPIKGKRGQTVNAFGRAYNYLLSTLRIYVEHHFARLQQFGILRDLYRGRFEDHEDVFCVVSGLLNFRNSGKFSLI